jgi:hypothetical protein
MSPLGAFLPSVPTINVATRRLHMCNESMTSSLYEPNTLLLAAFDGLEEVVRVVRKIPIDTRRLDDVPDAENADYLKLDVPGRRARCAPRRTAAAGPGSSGPHRGGIRSALPGAAALCRRGSGSPRFRLRPVHLRGDPVSRVPPAPGSRSPPSRRFRQALWTDAVYVRHLFELDRLDVDELARLFVILHVS